MQLFSHIFIYDYWLDNVCFTKYLHNYKLYNEFFSPLWCFVMHEYFQDGNKLDTTKIWRRCFYNAISPTQTILPHVLTLVCLILPSKVRMFGQHRMGSCWMEMASKRSFLQNINLEKNILNRVHDYDIYMFHRTFINYYFEEKFDDNW